MMAGATGLRVGEKCYADHAAAKDHVMSLVVPTITADGVLHAPVYQSPGQWSYAGHSVPLTLPPCDPMADFDDATAIGLQVIVLMFIAMVIKMGIRLFTRADQRYSDDD